MLPPAPGLLRLRRYLRCLGPEEAGCLRACPGQLTHLPAGLVVRGHTRGRHPGPQPPPWLWCAGVSPGDAEPCRGPAQEQLAAFLPCAGCWQPLGQRADITHGHLHVPTAPGLPERPQLPRGSWLAGPMPRRYARRLSGGCGQLSWGPPMGQCWLAGWVPLTGPVPRRCARRWSAR